MLFADEAQCRYSVFSAMLGQLQSKLGLWPEAEIVA